MKKDLKTTKVGVDENFMTDWEKEGWNGTKLEELGKTFEKLSYKEIQRLLNIFGISFAEKFEDIPKLDILDVISGDCPYEFVKKEVEEAFKYQLEEEKKKLEDEEKYKDRDKQEVLKNYHKKNR